jgi:UDP-glucose 4-epimerase
VKILVTGGAGFIGGVTVRQLLKAGYDVVVFDNLSCGHRQTIPKGVKLIEGDLRIKSDIVSAINSERPDAVLHFAAYTIVPESIENPSKYFENNILASFNLLDAMAGAGVKRFVFSSSAAVYGEPSEIPVTESARLAPSNAYGETKLIVEQYVKWYDIAYGIKYVSLRYFNASGADLQNDLGEDRAVETHLIPLVLLAASGKNKSVSVFGSDYPTRDGTCIRDYVHVKDLASAHILALGKLIEQGAKSSIYNLGSEKGFTVKEIVSAAEKVTEKKVNAEISPRRPGDPPALIASSKKIFSELGWKSEFSDIEQIISDTWSWMQRHPHGYTK